MCVTHIVLLVGSDLYLTSSVLTSPLTYVHASLTFWLTCRYLSASILGPTPTHPSSTTLSVTTSYVSLCVTSTRAVGSTSWNTHWYPYARWVFMIISF